jgi:hypothetical protein
MLTKTPLSEEAIRALKGIRRGSRSVATITENSLVILKALAVGSLAEGSLTVQRNYSRAVNAVPEFVQRSRSLANDCDSILKRGYTTVAEWERLTERTGENAEFYRSRVAAAGGAK